MAEFKTRRLPQSSTQASNANGMPEHLDAENPHPQYLLVSDYAGGGGTIDLSQYVTKTIFNQKVAEFESFRDNTATPKFTTLEAWKTSITTWKSEDADPAIALATATHAWQVNTGEPAVASIATLRSDLTSLDSRLSNHLLNTYAQNYNGVLPFHVDSSGQELYARRVHSHTASDIGAATSDHNHDNLYLQISDINNDRTTPAGDNVTALSSIFSSIGHGHDQYVTTYDLESVGVYPTSKNPFSSEDNVVSSIDLNDFTKQGIYNIHKTDSNQTINNAPSSSEVGTLVVISSQSVVSDSDTSGGTVTLTTPGVQTIQQLFLSDKKSIWSRIITGTELILYAWSNDEISETVYTNTASPTAGSNVYTSSNITSTPAGTTTAGDSASITYGGVVYTRASDYDTIGEETATTGWIMVNAPARINSTSNVSSGSAYTMNCLDADIHNIQLSANCTLSVSNLQPGQTAYLYVQTSGTYTLTYNSVVVLSTEDSGLFRIEFQNNGSSIRCVGVAVILA